MPMPPAADVAAQICADLGQPLMLATVTVVVDRILRAVKQADVLPGSFAVPIVGTAGTTPVTAGTKGKLA